MSSPLTGPYAVHAAALIRDVFASVNCGVIPRTFDPNKHERLTIRLAFDFYFIEILAVCTASI